MKLKEVYNLNLEKLNTMKIEDASLKLNLIIMNILNVRKEYIMIHFDEEFPNEKLEKLEKYIKRLENNEPIQYILNNQEFFGLEFYVDENVLIPQPDTEILVEEIIEIVKKIQLDNINKKDLNILDLCTGSGAIAITLSKNLQNCKIIASDISDKALEIADKNAKANNTKIKFIKSDLFKNINEKFDVIVSNPPYIKTAVIDTLSEEVKKEPYLALDGGRDGLEFYKKIASNAHKFLNTNGYLVLEIGYDQKEDVQKILEDNNFFKIYSKKDYGNNDRIVVGKLKK